MRSVNFDAYFDPDRYLSSSEGCAVCLRHVDDCICPECPYCGCQGDPKCYTKGACDLHESAFQIASRQSYEAEMAAQAEGEFWEVLSETLIDAFGMTFTKDSPKMSREEAECWFSLAAAQPRGTSYTDDWWREEARLYATQEREHS